MQLDPQTAKLAQAIALAQLEIGSLPSPRSAAERRAYAGRPADYVRDVLDVRILTEQQEQMLELMDREDRVLIPKANAIGGSFLLAAYAIYVLDAQGAELDDDGHEQGARVILMGPDHHSIEGTV